MPRNVRNFWIELHVGGKETIVKTGPVGKEGWFLATIRLRDKGVISNQVIEIYGTATKFGSLEVYSYSPLYTGVLWRGERDAKPKL